MNLSLVVVGNLISFDWGESTPAFAWAGTLISFVEPCCRYFGSLIDWWGTLGGFCLVHKRSRIRYLLARQSTFCSLLSGTAKRFLFLGSSVCWKSHRQQGTSLLLVSCRNSPVSPLLSNTVALTVFLYLFLLGYWKIGCRAGFCYTAGCKDLFQDFLSLTTRGQSLSSV